VKTLVQYYLDKVAEEAAEVAQIALKASQFGLSEIQSGKIETNAQRMYAELNDLSAMVHRLGEVSKGEFFFDIGQPDHVAIAKKLAKVEHYLAYSRSLELVEPEVAPNNPAVAAIQFALEADEGMEWLGLWNEGEFERCRREWPEAPKECYIGADQFDKEADRG
jgi:hypothetical protein